MATAPYEVNLSGTDDETFSFVLPFENSDGSAFDFGSYRIEYSVTRCGGQQLALKPGSGITIDAPNVTFTAPPLAVGEYEHGCRLVEIASGNMTQIFDGTITIGEGHFR